MKKVLFILFILIATLDWRVSAQEKIDWRNYNDPQGAVITILEEEPLKKNKTKIPIDSSLILESLDELVLVGNDLVPMILPQKNYGRYDRGLYNYLFIPKGKWTFALTDSYGELGTDNSQILSMITDIDMKIKGYSINPSLSYFFKHNQSLGLRFEYTHMEGNIDSFYADIMDDMNFDLSGVSYIRHNYSASLFYRNYVGLGRAGRFAIFNEVALKLGGGYSEFIRNYGGLPKDTHTDIFNASLDFSPGVCVFIQEYISFNVSFGVFGLHMSREKQNTDGIDEGTRFASGANFRFNIFNINFGMGIHF